MRMLCALAITAATAVACSKAGPLASGDLSSTEGSALTLLPKSANALVGGSYARVQKLIENPLFSKLMTAAEANQPGMQAWMKCWAGFTDVTFTGALAFQPGGVDLHMVLTNLSVDRLEKCATDAKLPVTVDPDRKYISIQTPGKSLGNYLVVPGGLFAHQYIKLPATDPDAIKPTERAALEAHVAAAAKENLSQNAALTALAKKVDRKRSIWFVGTGAGTPIADKLGEVIGTLELDDGLAFDTDVELATDALATQAAEGFDQLKGAGALLGKEIQSVVDNVKFVRDGKRLRIGVKLSNAQLEALATSLAKFLPSKGA